PKRKHGEDGPSRRGRSEGSGRGGRAEEGGRRIGDEVPQYKGLILGSPVYYGLPTAKIKEFIDVSVKHHGKLDGMVGGAFASAGGTHTGAETTVISLLEALMVHGMVVQGTSSTNHYGAASVGAPDEKGVEVCRKMGERLGKLAKKLHT
ncbi:MAG TPA: NAD(P)H-dependent oxidoreductase, partial [Candidatus Desulfaltia sp.]|nr:NAD(P)H-dependent oxidoreductase [Candidatus Desulfaltia sp.]